MLNAATIAATENLYTAPNRPEIVALLAKALTTTEANGLRAVAADKVSYFYTTNNKRKCRNITPGLLQKLIDNKLVRSGSYHWGTHDMELSRFGTEVLAATAK